MYLLSFHGHSMVNILKTDFEFILFYKQEIKIENFY